LIRLSHIDQQVLARLDAEGTDHFELSLDRIPAYRGAQERISSILSAGLEAKKFSGEALRDLNYTTVFQTSERGQIDVDSLIALPPLEHKAWTIVAVHPEFESYQEQVLVGDNIPTNSLLRNDIRFVRPLKSAKHYTQAQESAVQKNVFLPGNEVITGEAKEWGFVFGTKAEATGQQVGRTLRIMDHPAGTRRLVAVSYIKAPARIPDILSENDPLYDTYELEWPESMSELIIAVSLRILAMKQGDQTTLYGLNTQEMGLLLGAIS
jgi:hypothetical protein